MNELATLFARYGVESFLESTGLLVALLDQHGRLLSWNPAFDSLRAAHPDKIQLKDFLSSPSEDLCERLLSTALDQRSRTKGGLEFKGEERNDNFICLFIPLPEQRVLFIAERVTLASAP